MVIKPLKIFYSEKKWIIFIVSVSLVLGVFLRFYNLDQKPFWEDENTSLLKSSGYRFNEVLLQIYNGRPLEVEEIYNLHFPNPERGIIYTIASDSMHGPLYFIILRNWVLFFGNSILSARSLSAFISVLNFLLIYLLCRELFKSSIAGFIAISLIAISPFHLLYAQEVRQYGLWITTILLSSLCLLRDLRIRTKNSWRIYAGTLVLGLYTHLFFIFVAISHGVYVVFDNLKEFCLRKHEMAAAFVRYLHAFFMAIVFSIPWGLIIIYRFSTIKYSTRHLSRQVSLLNLFEDWFVNLTKIFFDIGDVKIYHQSHDLLLLKLSLLLICSFILIATIYSVHYIITKSPKKVWLFLISLIGVPFLSLAAVDLIFGGCRSIIMRYLAPSYLGVQLVFACVIAAKIGSDNRFQRRFWKTITVTIILLGITSCFLYSYSKTWWNKPINPHFWRIAYHVNQTHRPLLVSNYKNIRLFDLFSFVQLLKPKAKILLIKWPEQVPKIPEDYPNVFLYDASRQLKSKLQEQYYYEILPVDSSIGLWRIKVKNPRN